MERLAEGVEFMVLNQYIFFITSYFAQLVLKKTKEEKQLQNSN